MTWFVNALRQNPELAIFLTLALGFLIGKLKIGSFSFGTVVGTLLAGVLVGQLNIQVPGIVKTVFFDLFLFTTGYKVGPQFFRGLKKDALSQVAVTVVLCVTCLVAAFVAAKVIGYDIGTAAGLLAGAFSESTVIGTAGDAINRLALPAEERGAAHQQHPRRLCGHVPGGDGRPRLVHSHDRAQAHGGQPPGRGQEDAGSGRGRCGSGARGVLGGPAIRGPGLSRDQ